MNKELHAQWQQAFAEWMLHRTDVTASKELSTRQRFLATKYNKHPRALTLTH